MNDIRRKQRSNSHDGSNDYTDRGTAEYHNMLWTGGNGTGLSYCLKYADDSTDENPVVLAKGVDENGKEFEQRIYINDVINTNSKQYKALKEKGWLSGIMQNEAMMSAEERLIYETFGGRDTIIKNLMKQFDSDGDLLNANGVAGMDVTGKGTSWQQLTSVSEEYRQKMFDNVKREFIKENGISNGDTTKRSDIFKDYQLSVSKDKRLSGTWTLEQYEGQYRAAMYAAVKSANPNWKPGQKFDTSILDNVTRESVESTLVKNGNRLVRNSIDVSV